MQQPRRAAPDAASRWRLERADHTLRRRHGARGCNTNAQWVDAHDRYWTGTLGGLAVFDPGGDETDTVAKPLRLTERRLDGVAVNLAKRRADRRA